MPKKKNLNKGISIVALIVTIVVLLILAAVTISSLNGENGTINRANEAKNETDKSEITELVQLEAAQAYTTKGKFDSKRFKDNVNNHLSKYDPKINENDETIIVTIKGYDVVVDKDLGEIVDAPQTSTGVYPKVETELYQTNGTLVEEGQIYNEVILTAKITNKSDLDTYKITVTDSRGNVIEKNSNVTGDGDHSCTISRNGAYIVTVTGTKDGQTKTVKKTVRVTYTDSEVPTVSISPNGGTGYVMPTTGKAKLSASITSSNPSKTGIIYQYAWSTSGTSTPTSWTTITSAETVNKTDCTAGNYYLWVKVSDEKEILETNFVTSGAFVINPNTNNSSKIVLTPNTTKPTNQNVVVTATYGENLTQNKTLTCTGTENVDYIKNGTTSITVLTNGQTITASATDIMGNKIVITYKVENIDKVAPNTTAPSATATTNSITVSFAQTDSESGIDSSTRQYAIKKTSDSTWGSWITDSNATHTFTELTLDTSYDVKTQAKDIAGNGYIESAVKTIKTVNITKPTITLSTTAITNKNITATITYPEVAGTTKQYSYDNNTWKTYTGTLTIDSNRTIYARSIDNSGQGVDSSRVESVSVNNIDKTAPTISGAAASAEWTNTSKTITITASDTGVSGIAGYAITTNTTAPTSWTASTATSWTSTTKYGNGTYYAWVKDAAGNVSSSKTVTVSNIETLVPTISVSSNEMAAKIHAGTITIGDSNSGLAAGTYTVKYTWTTSTTEPTWSGISTTTTITVEAGAKTGTATITKSDGTGTYYLHVQGQTLKDQAGNTSSPTAYGTFKLDNTSPTVTFGTNGSTTYKKSQSTTVTVSDSGGSTVNSSSLKYQWTQSTTTPAESSFSSTFTSGGTITKSDGTGDNWYLWILAKDDLGNTTIIKSNAFYLDNTTPTTTVPSATATTNSITVTFAQTDSNSGINNSTKQYSIKKTSDSTWGSWVTDSNNTHTFTGLTLNTSYDVRTQVKDNVGNGYTVSSVKTITTVNITKPTITLSKTDWTNQNITATISYPSISGVTNQYSYDNSTWSTYSSALTIDSNKTIYARSIDSTNQGSDTTRVASLTVTNIDKTAPTMNSLTSGNTGATNGNITITGKATDTLSGIVAYQFSTSNSLTASSGGWTTITRTTSQVSYDYTVSGNGTYYFYVKDAAGNINKNSLAINNIDTTAPTISAATASTAWSNANKTITITASDTGGSGIAGYAITTSNSAPSSWIASTATSWTSTTTYGNGTYYAWVKDAAGNVSSSKSVTVSNIETAVPTISVSSNTTPAKSQTGTITIGDSNSGLAAGTYTVKYTWTTSTTAPTWSGISTTTTITVSAGAKTGTATVSKSDGTGTYYLHVQGQTLKDQAGNTSSPTAYGTFKIDNSAPTVTFGTNGSTTYKKSQSTTVTVADNGGSSVSTLKYQWTQSTTTPAENTFSSTFSSGETITKSDGTGNNWYLWILAKDSLGNTVITRSNAFYLDNTVPTTTVPSATSTTNSVTVTFAQTDSHSGINSSTKQYAIKKTSDSTWGSWVADSNSTHTFTGLTLNTSYDVKTQVKDVSGNGYTESSVKTITTVNITKPTITLSKSDWTNQNITATITYPNVTGVTKQYSYDNSTWSAYSSALTIDSNKTIYARSIDSTNQGSDTTRVASLTVTNIDKTAPTMNSLISGNTGATNGNITITGKATDTLSGIVAYQFSTSSSLTAASSGWTTITRTTSQVSYDYTASGNGTYYFYVKDAAGNINKNSIAISNIDKTSPTVSTATASTAWTNTNKTITITASDTGGSGIAGYAITTSTTAPTSWISSTATSWTSTSAYGNGTYYAWVKDAAGNVSTSKAVTVSNIETAVPTISVSSNTTPAKSQTGTITIGDSNSGLAAGTYTVKYTWTTSTSAPTWSSISTTTSITVSAGAKTGTATVSKNGVTGTYYLHVQGQTLKDQAGNTSSPTAFGTFKIDNSGPTVTFGTNGSTTYAKSQSTTVTVADNEGSSVNASSLKYQWTQSTTTPAESTFSSTFTSGGTITKSNGTGNNWYLWILAKDSLGNTVITRSNAFYLDNTAPGSTAPTATSTTNSITVTSKQADSHSGINASTRQYSIKKASDSTWGSWVTDSNTTHTFTGLTLNTSYNVRTQIKDAVGNGYTVSSTYTITTVNITKPTITLSTTALTNQNITATITYPSISGITKQYSYNNSTWYTYSSALTIDSNKTIYARSIDSTNQGSDSTRVASLTVTNIDKTAPTVSHTTNPVAPTAADSVTITINATDDLSGIASITNTTTNNITKVNNTTYIVTENGDYNFKITDKANNIKNYTTTITNVAGVYPILYTDGTLSFGMTNEPMSGKTVSKKYGNIKETEYKDTNEPWYDQRSSIKKAIFLNEVKPKSTSKWFYYCNNLTTIDGISNLNTQDVTNMKEMFYQCGNLTSLDVSGFDTRKVTDMSDMFCWCDGLTSLDVKGFDTSNVTDMAGMFRFCLDLTSLDVSGFYTRNVTDMAGMFDACNKLTTIDVSRFDTRNVSNMSYMFDACSSLTSLDVSGFDTSNVMEMDFMFDACSSLTSLDVSGFNTSNVTEMDYMFSSCSGLTNIDVSGFDTNNVRDMSGMFYGCSSLTSLDLSRFNTSYVSDVREMFSGCYDLVTIYGNDWTSNSDVTSSEYVFSDCTKLKGSISFDDWQTTGEMCTPNGGYFTEK